MTSVASISSDFGTELEDFRGSPALDRVNKRADSEIGAPIKPREQLLGRLQVYRKRLVM